MDRIITKLIIAAAVVCVAVATVLSITHYVTNWGAPIIHSDYAASYAFAGAAIVLANVAKWRMGGE